MITGTLGRNPGAHVGAQVPTEIAPVLHVAALVTAASEHEIGTHVNAVAPAVVHVTLVTFGRNPPRHVGTHELPTAISTPEHAVALDTVGAMHPHAHVAGSSSPLTQLTVATDGCSGDAHVAVHSPMNAAPAPHVNELATVAAVHSGTHFHVLSSPSVVHVIVVSDGRYPAAHVGVHDDPWLMRTPLHAVACATVGAAHWHVHDVGAIVPAVHVSDVADGSSGDAHIVLHVPRNHDASPHAVAIDTVGTWHAGSHVNAVGTPLNGHATLDTVGRNVAAHVGVHVVPVGSAPVPHVSECVTAGSVHWHIHDVGVCVPGDEHVSDASLGTSAATHPVVHDA